MIMATTKTGFHVDRRVSIATDALTPQQKSLIDPLLTNQHRFVLRANRTGMAEKLSNKPATYALNAGGDLRIIYSETSDGIVVRDIMRESTLRQLTRAPKAAKKAPAAPAAAKEAKESKAANSAKLQKA